MSKQANCLYFSIKSDMRIFLKLLFLLPLSSGCLAGIVSHASIGAGYTGGLVSYVQTGRETVNSGFDTVYAAVYALFSRTWLNIVKSVEYQWLVCLWAIKDQSLLSQLQKDRTTLKIALNRDFVELEKKVSGLEERNAMQKETEMIIFDSGTSYETERAKLKDEIDAKVQSHRTLITGFATSYVNKIGELITTFGQYRDANKSLTQGLVSKMEKVQQVLSAFEDVERDVNSIDGKIAGADDFVQTLASSRAKGLTNLNASMQSFADTTLKKYKKLQNLNKELLPQKLSTVAQYNMDFDEFLSKKFKYRYDRSTYIKLRNEIEGLRAVYYAAANQLNCSSILIPGLDNAVLLSKIASLKAEVDSWRAKIEKEGIPTTFKDQMIKEFQSMYLQKFKQRYAEYQEYLKNYIKGALRNLVSSLIPPPPTENSGTWDTIVQQMPRHIFSDPFKSWQYDEEIKILQNVLINLWLYSWAIDGIYNKDTKNAVYQFQLSKWLLKGYEKKSDVRWRFGPGTRAAVNKITK